MQHHVFYDPTGKRAKRLRYLGLIVGLLSAVLVVVLCSTIVLLPTIPLPSVYKNRLTNISLTHESRENAAQHFVMTRTLTKLRQQIEREKLARNPQWSPASSSTVIGFYVNWEPGSYSSLARHIDALTYVMPEWLSISQGAQSYVSRYLASSHDPDVVTLASQHHVPIMPILNNADQNDFQWEPLKQLLTDYTRQVTLAHQLRDYLVTHQFAGINIDFEPPYNLMTDAQITESRLLLQKELPRFLQVLRTVFSPDHLLITQDLPANDPAFDYEALAQLNDYVIVMLYDQHTPDGDPGPIASQEWIEQSADRLFKLMDDPKVILGLGNYCYDWPVRISESGDITRIAPGRELPLGAALHIAREAGADVHMDEGDLNPYFTYDDDDGTTHMVYMLDAVTAYNQYHALKGYLPGGVALWYLGSEDPAIWSFLHREQLPNAISPSALSRVDFCGAIATESSLKGDELMQVAASPKPGARQLTSDTDGLITAEHYQSYPTPFVIRQLGVSQQKVVALTFDDGPDPQYTPAILRILREQGVRGTFFMVGDRAERYSGIVKQCWKDGNEIGNHTYTHPHILQVSSERARLEVNATQVVLASITGHRSLLFRPPYGDSPDAVTVGPEALPMMAQLQRAGYITVGMNIDPQDYLNPGPSTILQRILHQVPGNHVILLHDSGGNRQQTVEALPQIIQVLRAKGYRFVTVSELIGPAWHARLFPPVTTSEKQIVGIDRLIFNAGYTLSDMVSICFIAAIALGILRILILCPLAVLERRRNAASISSRSDYAPAVTVVIPAYNECTVITRTVESVLHSDYTDLTIIIVDDGSTDETAAVITRQFAHDQRICVLQKANEGKALALNLAFSQATTEIIVCMDADTIFSPTTIRHLVHPLEDPHVGAVAGNVKVGNRVNLLTLWQAIEYITCQNFDRLAFSYLSAVPVIPGAVSAWRKSAVLAAGGFHASTLAEDTDLTFRLRLSGYFTRCVNQAVAYTEVPDTLPAFVKQRFRWSFGILQALWKHRSQIGRLRHGAFGVLVMPVLWLFNIVLQVLAPLVDLSIVIAVWSGHGYGVLFYSSIFLLLDMLAAVIAFRFDNEPYVLTWWLVWQRFFYRQVMYLILLRAMVTALTGQLVGWGKLQRKATVKVPATDSASDISLLTL